MFRILPPRQAIFPCQKTHQLTKLITTTIATRPSTLFLQPHQTQQAQLNRHNYFSHLRRPYRTTPTMTEKQKKQAPGDRENLEGKENEWKFRHPYTVHDNGDMGPHYDGSCHCGRVKYQLKKKEPLEAKFCHCTTCQVLHGMDFLCACTLLLAPILLSIVVFGLNLSSYGPICSRWMMKGCTMLTSLLRGSFRLDRHLRQRGHQLHPRPPRPRLVRQPREDHAP